MTYEKIIFGIGILIGILFLNKTTPKLLVLILISWVISFVLLFIENQLLTNFSFVSFGIISFIFIIYSGIKRKGLNLIIGFFAFASFISKIMNYPYENELKLLMIFPIASYILILKEKENYKNELSILTIFVAYELSEFVNYWIN